MQLRALGRSDLQVSPLAFGGNVFGWTVDEAQSFRLLDAWLDAGFNFVDTADVYSRWVPGHTGGESETIIGKWFRQSGKRNRVVLATKVGKPMGDDKVGLSAAYIREAVDASLQRLKTDHIDLYQSHDDDANTPLEETLEAFAALIKAGKVRAIGASNFTAPRLAEALDVSERLGIPRYESLQPLYNLYDRAVFEEALEPLCVERGVGVINFYALAAGFLTGKYRSEADAAKSARGANTTKKYLNERGLRILGALDGVAKTHGVTPAQAAIAWQIARPGITAPIASATSVAQLDELTRAATLKLDAASIALLDAASQEQGATASR
ncbi:MULTISPECIES: aldo/keto reductase [unclassified Variovorax]|uniref:aldo/keto reductase n=1 Tax=unclassified Variovorax TaxID=663243 RepID=UPI00257564E0|nr:MULTISPECIES: aldo/keto reductase [unclassified Variovorax]MDM0089379.1 aldo/keto reductase [Variovorax sp. J22G40]MDM0147451.1 aldo/keto reductase [Variovorax sp. J2P1-31]